MTQKITAQLEAINPDRITLYRQADNGWTIAKFRETCGGALFTGKGVISFDPKDGDLYDLDGEWRTSDYNGAREFVFTSAIMSIPEDKRSLLTYAVAITTGLGDAKERAIWDAYGNDWQSHPELDGVKGVTADARFNWGQTLERLGEEQVKTQAIGFLLHAGCTMIMASKAWEAFGVDTLARVKRNPYELANLPRVGFQMVDGAIRRELGVGDDDPRRVRAALLYSMERLAQESGTLVQAVEIHVEVERLTACGLRAIENAIYAEESEGLIYIVGPYGYALAEDYENEMKIWEYAKGELL